MSSPTTVLSVTDFLRDAARSRVLTEDAVTQAFAEAPPAAKWQPDKFADHLVSLGQLTRFQADKLLRGHWQGLALGPYRLLVPLGRGGMGIVYLAQAADAKTPVALKVLPPQRAKDEPRMLTRFQREMVLGRKLPAHPNLTRTLDAGEWGGVYYLAMEYVPGKTVRQHVFDSGPLSIGRAARVFADAALGLHRAHTAGFVHRDIKPSNIVVMPGGRAKVLDFGFALEIGEPAPTDPTILGGQGYTIGTMDYLAPEQAADAVAVGPAADLYALGCSLYFALSGSPPFPTGSAQDKIRWHRTHEALPLRQLNATVPAELVKLIESLMAKKPEKRPASADETARQLLAFADPVKADPIRDDPNNTNFLLDLQANWEAKHEPDDSIILVEDPPPNPFAFARSIPAAWIPRRLIVIGGLGFAVALFAALILGWLVAQALEH